MKSLIPAAALLALSACSSMGGNAGAAPDVDVSNAQVAVHTEENGDVIEEYRVAGQLRMVKVTPARGPAYYLIDQNGDGRMDPFREGDQPPQTYWKLYGW